MHDDEEPIRIPITEVFDLHAVEQREVAALVEAYLEEAARLGLDTVRIIHGRGIAVQRRIVRAGVSAHAVCRVLSGRPARGGRPASHHRELAGTR
jgi:DNA-nicking Smr family endonuclease